MVKKKSMIIVFVLAVCMLILPMSVYAATIEESNSESEYLYFIVEQDDLKEVSANEYYEIVGERLAENCRTTGSWSINSSLIEAGQRMYYYQSNGDYFVVGAREYIELEINPEIHSRTFKVGYNGTSTFETEISLPIFRGARVAFIDALVVPGSYRVLVQNMGRNSEVINGHIYVYER